MTQKVIKVGSSAAVTIPKKSLEGLGIKIGDSITLDIDMSKKTATIKPTGVLSSQDSKIAKLTMNFIDRYRKDLEALSRK